MKGFSFRRIGSGVIVASLLALAVAVPAAAADTRIIYVGSTFDSSSCAAAAANPARVGSLSATEFSRGGQFKVDAWFVNCGGQNLSNVRFTVGKDPGQLDILADAFTEADGIEISESLSQLPSGLKCNALPTTLLSCTLKSLRPGVENGIFVSLVFTSTIDGTGSNVYVAGKAAENTNDGGSNQDTFEATTALNPTAFDCDSVTTLFSPGNKTAATCPLGTANPQSSKVGYGTTATVEVSETNPGALTGYQACPGAGTLSPVWQDVNADIEDSADGNDVEWTIQIDLKAIGKQNVKPSDVVICHWDDDQNISGPLDGYKVTKSNKGVLTLTFTTDGNGKTRILG